jgi:hypothetical protein
MASITIWSRLEPHSREASMERSLRAAARDPLWLLARQDQLGEFYGTDAGSPVNATTSVESAPLTSYRPGANGTVTDLVGPPVETHVEREPVALGLLASVQFGLYFERSLVAATVPQRDDVLTAFRNAYQLPTLPQHLPDPAAERFRLAVVGDGPNQDPRVTDGEALFQAIKNPATDLDTVAPMPSLTTAQRTAVRPLLGGFRDYRGSFYSEPVGDSAWDGFQLRYQFALGSETIQHQRALESADFHGGHLDWYSFDLAAKPLRGPGTTADDLREFTFLPTQIRFRGMPNPRWWNFEDGFTDFGDLQPDKVDLAKLLVMEFALLGADDWFQLPIPLDVGSLSSATTLVVTDNFGERTLIRPTGAQAPDLAQPWRMFTSTGSTTADDLLLLAPVLTTVTDGPDLESVLFARDEMAALGWAIEEKLHGGLDNGISGYESYFQRLAANPPPEPQQTPGGPEVAYRLATDIPDNWIPLVPVRSSIRSFVFRRGVMGGPTGRPALARTLEPQRAYYLADEAIPKAGLDVTDAFRLTRSNDGETHLWLAKRVQPGRGPGSSGLAFDLVQTLNSPPG